MHFHQENRSDQAPGAQETQLSPVTPEIMLVAGEASGDMHGAALVRALKAARPELRFSGMGGPELAAAGLNPLVDAARVAVVGLVEVLGQLGAIARAWLALARRLQQVRPALLILIDFPDFNLLLARRAKKLGIPVFYYISPQIWAWRKKRVHLIGRLTDMAAVILPFEEPLYRQHGYQARFVGHPLLDRVRPEMPRAAFLKKYGLAEDIQAIALAPGSRRGEIKALLPVFLETAAQLCASDTATKRVFFLPLAPTIDRALFDACGVAACQNRLDLRVITKDRYSMMAACDACLAASGTVTLELALLGVPTVAAYRVAFHTYWLGRIVIRRLPFFALPNLIMGREIIPELLQNEVRPEKLLASLRPLLRPSQRRSAMCADFQEVRQRLGGCGASERVAELALRLLDERPAQARL